MRNLAFVSGKIQIDGRPFATLSLHQPSHQSL